MASFHRKFKIWRRTAPGVYTALKYALKILIPFLFQKCPKLNWQDTAAMSLRVLPRQALGIKYENKLALYEEWGDVDRIFEDTMPNIKASNLSETEIRKFLEIFFS